MRRNNGISYEILTKGIFEEILSQEKVENLRVEQNANLNGKTATHQIDVYWKFEVAGICYETIVQAKDWRQPVKLGELLKFREVINDLPGQPKGVFVTRTGYQSGAEDYAKAHGILLYVLFEEPNIRIVTSTLGFAKVSLVPPKNPQMLPDGCGDRRKERTGWLWEIAVFDSHIQNSNFEIDGEWMLQRLGRASRKQAMSMKWKKRPKEIKLYDEAGNVIGDLEGVYRSIVDEMRNANEFERQSSYKFLKPTFIETSSALVPKIKINGVASVIEILEKERYSRLARRKGIVSFVLRNLTKKSERIFERPVRNKGAGNC